MKRTEKLAMLYKQANALNEELPKELIDKLSLYGQVLEIIGGLHAESVKAWKLAEAHRREAIASAIVYGAEVDGTAPKTAKEKEAAAEVIGAEARRNEALAEAEAQRWRNAYTSTLEMIQILKKKYEHMKEVSKGGI
ncbi:hypothetical protein P9G49_03955 [Heyndrickxia coagulans]|uniref:hypothetical protein n=1 Tax=Heyndrickxia coagulans TaxID=1398 RepID=UPI002DFB961B|nr:hypothetical protein [Heyndrickxia coagulans]